MREKDVQKEIHKHFITQPDTAAVIPNIYFFDDKFEQDTLIIKQNGWTIEAEIKASKFDYVHDFRKKEKHERMEAANNKTIIPNWFYFVCPEGLIDPQEIPHYTGLIWVYDKGMGKRYIKIVQKAPTIHTLPIDETKWQEVAIKLAARLW